MDELRTCTKCHTEKPVGEFYVSKGKIQVWCKECYAEYHRSRYTPRNGEDDSPRACGFCGESFAPKQRRHAVFCSQKCKNDARIAADRIVRAETKASRTCAICAVPIAHLRADARYCSQACANKRPTAAIVSRRSMLKTAYGIKPERYEAMATAQGNRCAVCRTDDPGAKKVWAVDHDHVTGQVRGLLCSKCNTGIGQLRDDPTVIRAALDYVVKHRQLVLPVT